MNKSPVVHFEMPYQNSKRVSDFYKAAFGWNMQNPGPEYGDYILAITTDVDKKMGRPTTPGAINGGFYKKTNESNPYPSFVISVDDINKGVESVKKAGGKMVG
ncbi:glyoxalase [candidate division WWE3 bacterium CG10_big_fil_rev_8_21_14_0_10_32_10]|uniref:Glyoxalase n=1 Tax=candidate division WWE3 bacterium CG10_big_fil_rev_8_21_14_0_10_32_10 TaxID=1975090 RepID=A0A2H0R9Y5_UNCKA|nr:MAG: glyoxalase [candidate division WWE3 bacterium CG10_big_fil_rev_8_21_14_0_10_32_10]